MAAKTYNLQKILISEKVDPPEARDWLLRHTNHKISLFLKMLTRRRPEISCLDTKIIKHYNNDIIKQLTGFHRQALHAKKISFQHPKKLDFMTFESRLPDDFQTLLQLLNSGSLEK